MNHKLKEVFRGEVVNKAHTINTGVMGVRSAVKKVISASTQLGARSA